PFQTLADTATLPNHWSVNEFSAPRFSDDGQRLYFSTSPIAQRARKDTLTPDDEKVKVDVWSWTDSRLQPMQQKRLKQEKERGYVAVYDLANQRLTPLASREVPGVEVDYRANPRYLMGESDQPYQASSSWDPGHTDLYLVDSQTGSRTKIANDVMVSRTSLSPGGRYACWYDERDSLWRAYSVQGRKLVDLTRSLPVKFFDEEHDSPSLPGSYGSAGWTKDDRYVWLYDRYDIWQLDPTGAEKPVNITAGWGRDHNVRLRRAMLTPQDSVIDANADLWLTGFWEADKHWGVLKEKNPAAPNRSVALLTQSNHHYTGLQKAKNGPTLTYLRGNFREPNNLFVTDTTFGKPVQLTRVNPQQDSVRWGSVELVKWLGTNGTNLEGLLYKPDNFDPAKKYPMLVYYYERNSETMNDYRAPSPSRSTINIPYCVSNGYLVFVPDIIYTIGQPGPDAYDCVVPGVLSLLDKGFVDRDRIGLQGQSWGGYQTAYIITRTNLFKAAMAGAPVANMTSAYGGIRWGTGMSRMFQYEKTQSRIGGTLWEKPMSYIENSPLFAANRIETPLMMMHNDADGSVPWYQGIEMFTALRRLNKPVWMVTYNGEDHNLTMRHNMKDLSVRLYQFFDYYLKDAPMPVWMKEGRTAVEKDRGEMKY
ncbi:MAG: S9 family peptidase, partial [Bacteroidetes bacterium]|nr:S9 family peptidase [Fibrella sp.]